MELQSYLKSVWNGWVITDVIGQGAFGKVYKIERQEYGQAYYSALKVLEVPQNEGEVFDAKIKIGSDASVTEYFEKMIEDIIAEVTLMSKLQGNSHIVSYQDHAVVKKKDEFGWIIFIRMELLKSLHEVIGERTLAKEEIVNLGIDICKALESCSKINIIHRDIKPGNIFVSNDGYKLGDFGIARTIDDGTAILSTKGTYPYMAPEVYKMQPYSSTADVYSLGLVLYHLFNHNRIPLVKPFPEPLEHYEEKIAEDKRIAGAELPCPQELDDPSLWNIIKRACEYDRKKRYQSAEEMRNALEKWKERETDPVHPSPKKYLFLTIVLLAVVVCVVSFLAIEMMTPVVMPELEGLSKKNAKKTIEANDLVLGKITYKNSNKVEKDEVISQSIEPWQKVKKKTDIDLVISKGKKIVVPDICGLTEEVAQISLNDAGLTIGSKGADYSDEVESGIIIGQAPGASNKVDEGTKVNYVVSMGKEMVVVPDVKGKSEIKAVEEMGSLGLECRSENRSSSTVSVGIVIEQNVDPGAEVERGSQIILYVSNGVEPTVPSSVQAPDQTIEDETKNVKEEVHLEDEDILSPGTYVYENINENND